MYIPGLIMLTEKKRKNKFKTKILFFLLSHALTLVKRSYILAFGGLEKREKNSQRVNKVTQHLANNWNTNVPRQRKTRVPYLQNALIS